VSTVNYAAKVRLKAGRASPLAHRVDANVVAVIVNAVGKCGEGLVYRIAQECT
jgi:hypothetical protein